MTLIQYCQAKRRLAMPPSIRSHKCPDSFSYIRDLQILRIDHLHYHSACCTTAVANGSTSVFALLELMEEGDQNSRA